MVAIDHRPFAVGAAQAYKANRMACRAALDEVDLAAIRLHPIGNANDVVRLKPVPRNFVAAWIGRRAYVVANARRLRSAVGHGASSGRGVVHRGEAGGDESQWRRRRRSDSSRGLSKRKGHGDVCDSAEGHGAGCPAAGAAPLQPMNVYPAAGDAVSVTVVPAEDEAAQLVPQSMPAGKLVMVPWPTATTSRKYALGVAVGSPSGAVCILPPQASRPTSSVNVTIFPVHV